jgi:hypothetical protein
MAILNSTNASGVSIPGLQKQKILQQFARAAIALIGIKNAE